ncbi:MAG: RNA-directed DNA polymerase [Parcubacteria group bacterium]
MRKISGGGALKENENEKRGLPIGNITSQIFANIYLNELDWFIKRELKVKNYFRYADDFTIIYSESDYLENILSQVADFLKNELKLELHPNKVEIRKFSQGIDFLGYVTLPHYIVLRTKTKKRMFKKIQNKKNDLKSGIISEESFNQSLQSYLGVLKHCEGWKIREKIKSNLRN